MKRTYTIAEANRILPLVRVIAKEYVERRNLRRSLHRDRENLENAITPEGLRSELAELDARVAEQDEALAHCRREFEGMGMRVLQTNPLTLHIHGQSRTGPVVFCWVEGEGSVCFGHAIGEEEDSRRPLKLKTA